MTTFLYKKRLRYKYSLYADYYHQTDIQLPLPISTKFVDLDTNGLLTIKKNYAWNGANEPAFDTKNIMRGSLVHDALYQLIREKLIPPTMRAYADWLLREICIKDGMSKFRADLIYISADKFGLPHAGIDIIVNNQSEVQVLLRAVESKNQEGSNIDIQSIERKDKSMVVRIRTKDKIDNDSMYAEIMKQVEKEHEKQLLEQQLKLTVDHHKRESDLRDKQAELLAKFINKTIENPKVKIMNDNSRRIEHASISHSAVNFGDRSTVSNHIEQVADAELKTILQDLQQLLEKSNLPAIDKQEAQQAVNDLAAISQKPEAERKSLARRSLVFLKDLHKDLSSVAELGEQYGKLLIKIMAWF